MQSLLSEYLKLIRPQQWIKNVFVATPLFFGGKALDTSSLLNTSICFFCFCFCASAVYIYNDYKDITFDKVHPTKKDRPLAAGKIPITHAFIIQGACIIIGFGLCLLLPPKMVYILFAYVLINFLYSSGLKNIAFLDILILALGFVLRVLAGGESTNILVSNWLFVLTFLLALFIALGKRYDDLLLSSHHGVMARKSIKGYSIPIVKKSMVLMAIILMVAYVIYISSPTIASRYGHTYGYFSILFVAAGIMRYFQLCFVLKKSASPTKLIYSDYILQLLVIGWIVYFYFIIY